MTSKVSSSFMMTSLLIITLSSLFIIIATSPFVTATSECFAPDATPFSFPASTSGFGPVDRGFYAPNLSATSTEFFICPPTEECLRQRINGEFCGPQGTRDVAVCPSGHFCPNATGDKIICPEGYFCPVASVAPVKCNPMSYCPEGAANQIEYSSILILVCIFIIFAVMLYFVEKYVNEARAPESSSLPKNSPTTTTVANSSSASSYENALITIRDAVRRRRQTNNFTSKSKINKDEELCISFDNIGVSVAVSKSERKEAEEAAEKKKTHHDNDDDNDDELKEISDKPTTASATSQLRRENYNPIAFNENGEKILLHPISGKIRSKKLSAVLGGSGAGKTVFAGRLLGRFDSNWNTSGKVTTTTDTTTIDEAHFKELVSFVPQDDIVHYNETIHQNIFFSSESRLPPSWSTEDKNTFRRAVLEALQILPYQDRQVGLPGDLDEAGAGGISGGQRKRCSIGVELAAAPIALVCDELTTGLDSEVAKNVMLTIKRLVQEANLCALCILHTPSVEVWRTIDEVVLLSPGGRLVYLGPRELIMTYFKKQVIETNKISAETLKHEADITSLDKGNPADLIIDLVAAFPKECVEAWQDTKSVEAFFESAAREEATSTATTAENQQQRGTLPVENLQNIQGQLANLGVGDDEDNNSNNNKSNQQQQTVINSTNTNYQNNNEDDESRPGFFRQTYISFIRRMLSYAIDWKIVVFDIILTIVSAAIMSTIAVGEKFGAPLAGNYVLLSARKNFDITLNFALFSCFGVGTAASPTSIRVFGDQKSQLLREFRSGNGIFSLLLGYSLAELIRCFILSFIYSTVGYLMFQPTFSFGIFLGLIYSLWLCLDALGALLGVIFDISASRLYALVAAIFASLCNGLTPIPFYIISFTHWYSILMMGAEYEYSHQTVYDMPSLVGGEGLEAFPADPISQRALSIIVVVVWFLGLKALTYVSLWWISRN